MQTFLLEGLSGDQSIQGIQISHKRLKFNEYIENETGNVYGRLRKSGIQTDYA
jgi:hypothetical protein